MSSIIKVLFEVFYSEGIFINFILYQRNLRCNFGIFIKILTKNSSNFIMTIVYTMGVKPNGKLLETNMAVNACDPPLLHGAFQFSCCPPAPLPEYILK